MTIDYSKWDAIECSSSDSEEANDVAANDDYYDDDFEGEEVVERDAGEKKNGRRRTMRTKKNPRNGMTKNETRCIRTTTSS